MKTKLFQTAVLILVSVLSLLAAAPVTAQSKIGNDNSLAVRTVRLVKRQPPPKSKTFKNPPDPQPESEEDENENELPETPVDSKVRPQDIRPMNPPSVAAAKDSAKTLSPQAPGDFQLYRNTSLASAPVVSGVTLNNYVPIEPSVAKNGRVVLFTSNSYDAFSGDGGQTFTYINPFDYFPADGTNDAIDGGFGGDQYAFYEPTRGLMFWLIQYNPNAAGTTNRQRLCVNRSQSATLNGGCEYFIDFNPAFFQIPTPSGAIGTWLDFPDVAVSDNLLYLTSNVFRCNATPCTGTNSSGGSNSAGIGAVVWRISLDQLISSSGGITANIAFDSQNFGFRLTQGARDTMYWAAHQTTTKIRIYRWSDAPGSILFDDVDHAAYNTGTMSAPSPDGTNFAARANSNIQAAWVANGVIGFMWNVPQGANFPYPYVEVVRFNESNRSLLSQGQIYNNNHAWLYPSVAPNGRGHLGGTLAFGGGTFYPGATAWIADDYNNNTIIPLENVVLAQGTAGPNDGGGAYNRWGDYFSTRLNRPFLNSWVGTSFVYQAASGGGNNIREPHFTWFGRERDRVPANIQIYVRKDSTAQQQDGTAQNPYRTVADGIFAASPGDTVIIRGAFSYDERLTINKAITVKNENGTVIIGKP